MNQVPKKLGTKIPSRRTGGGNTRFQMKISNFYLNISNISTAWEEFFNIPMYFRPFPACFSDAVEIFVPLLWFDMACAKGGFFMKDLKNPKNSSKVEKCPVIHQPKKYSFSSVREKIPFSNEASSKRGTSVRGFTQGRHFFCFLMKVELLTGY